MYAVLLVEDEPSTREFLAEALLEGGHRVHAVQNAEVALLMLEEGVPCDVVVTDVLLPWGIDGFEFARRARTVRPELKFLYVTGHSALAHEDASALDGVLLTKPMRLYELHAAVEEAVAGGRGVAQCRVGARRA